MERVVITGATGAIGRALIQTCIAAGYEVLAVVHRTSQRAAELEKTAHCRVLYLDLAEYGKAMAGMRHQGFPLDGYTMFFHLAWMAPFGSGRDDLSLQLANVQASLDAARFAKELGCTVFLGTGSQAEYGRAEGMISPDTPAFPETGYGTAKLCAGQMTRLSCRQLGLRHIWCRVLSIYGPHDRAQTLISTAVRQMLLREETAFTPCDQMWDYLYADDAANAILLAAAKGADGQTYMVGSGEVHPLREFIEEIARLTGYEREIGFGKRPYNDKQVMYLQADMESMHALGFRQQVPFAEGIRRTIAWQRKEIC